MNIVCTKDDRFNGPTSFSILYFSVVMVREEPVMVSSGKKTLWPSRRRYILWRRMRYTILPLAEVISFCANGIFLLAPFFLPFNLSRIDVPKNYGFDMSCPLCLRLSLSLSLSTPLQPSLSAQPRGTSLICVHTGGHKTLRLLASPPSPHPSISLAIRPKFIAPISIPGKLERERYDDICSV